ncbi:M20 family metallo-hydrolase [Microbacterium paludicola]|uniref:M20 family metallo-hydrolase n=1 Tax=Microbacterium paludicola TaxID=300019 RepID=UPI00119D3159|nr:M20 family metallo-hydrolase [Microbacterium paludicola]
MTDRTAQESFLDDFARLSSFGATAGGGVERLAGSPEHAQLREWLAGRFVAHGFTAHFDAIGNLFGLAELVPGAPFVLFGSHTDSQPLAGRFDGAYGVLTALHAASRVVADHRRAGSAPTYNIAIVDWFNEEGARFKPSMMGSGVFTGKLTLADALATRDPAGTSVASALRSTAMHGDFTSPPLAAYGEIHIEQGRSMDAAGVTIGAVDATWSAYKYEVVVHGEQGHTGSARMSDRRDALLGAAHLVTAVHDLIEHFEVDELHTSVGEFTVAPNSPVTIAREVRLLADLRAETTGLLDEAFAHLESRIAEIEQCTRTRIEIVSRSVWRSGPFLQGGIRLIERSAAAHGFSQGRVKTLAGHDATNMKDMIPTLLAFIPSVDGISHNEREFSTDADMLAGLSVFEDVVRELSTNGMPE